MCSGVQRGSAFRERAEFFRHPAQQMMVVFLVQEDRPDQQTRGALSEHRAQVLVSPETLFFIRHVSFEPVGEIFPCLCLASFTLLLFG